jgi:hypothetical protein
MIEDLGAEFPAIAARAPGWTEVPLMCTREIPVPGSLGKCIRVLLHVNTTRGLSEIQHVYIHRAVHLRPTFAVQLSFFWGAHHDDDVNERPGGREAGDESQMVALQILYKELFL